MTSSVTVDDAILNFACAVFLFSMALTIHWASNRAIATVVPAFELVLEDTADSHYFTGLFGSTNLTTLKGILTAANLNEVGVRRSCRSKLIVPSIAYLLLTRIAFPDLTGSSSLQIL